MDNPESSASTHEHTISSAGDPFTCAGAAPQDRLDLGPYLQAVEVLGEVPNSHGLKYRVVCPWVNEHAHGDRSGTRLGTRSGGALWFHCDHEHCNSRGWREFKRVEGTVRTYTVNPNLKVKVIRRYGR